MDPVNQRKLDELYAWLLARKQQQLIAPFDDVSKAVIGAAIGAGAGSSALTQTVGSGLIVPSAYLGTQFLLVDGTQLEFPYLSKA